MMNALALCLVISSLAAAGLFSPQPEQKQRPPKEQQQHHERDRIIVIEYEREVPGDTQHAKDSTPPSPETYGLHDKSDRSMASGVFEDAKDKFEQAGSVLPNLGQGVSETSEKNADYEHRQQPRELICDALGKCKHRIAEVLGKAKEKVEEAGESVDGVVERIADEVRGAEVMGKAKEGLEAVATGEVFGKAKEAREAAKEKTGEVLGNVKDRVTDKAHEVEETSEKVKEKAKGVPGDVKEKVFEKSHEIGEEIKEAGEDAKEKTEQVWGKANDGVKEAGECVVEKTKGAVSNVKERVIEKEHEFEQGVKEAGQGQTTKKTTLDVMEYLKKGLTALCDQRSIKTKAMGLFREGGRNFTNLIRSGGKQAYNAIRQTVVSESTNLAMAVVQLIGFGIAFGASVWITFVSSFVLSTVLPKGLFGVVQSKIYPMYFKISVASIVCTLIVHVGRCLRSGEGGSAAKYQVWNLLGAIVMVLLNLYWLEPRASKVMFERMKLEKEEGRGVGIPSVQEEVVEPSIPTATPCDMATFGPSTTEGGGAGATAKPVERSDPGEQEEVQTKLRVLSRRLKKLNTYSSNLNMTTIMCLTWHLIYLAQHLQVA